LPIGVRAADRITVLGIVGLRVRWRFGQGNRKGRDAPVDPEARRIARW
jgi:hypothetical protein